MKHLRPLYEKWGVEQYYRQHAQQYQNPHLPQIEALIKRNADKMDLSAPLDFCCGGGEVTQTLLALGGNHITASDPFTHQLFAQHFPAITCYQWDFQAVVRGEIQGNFSCIICSFALHLAPEQQLFTLAWNLLQHAPLLVVITPHKRPAIEEMEGFSLLWADFECTKKGKKVFMKAYQLATIG